MKNKIILLLLVTTTFAFSGITGFFTQNSRDWNFIQSVGGMKVSLKEKMLHVDCDVSGFRKVTVKPTTINSALCVYKIKHKRLGNKIQIRLVTSVIDKDTRNNSKIVNLSSYPVGEYLVQYIDADGATHPLGKIKLREKDNKKK